MIYCTLYVRCSKNTNNSTNSYKHSDIRFIALIIGLLRKFKLADSASSFFCHQNSTDKKPEKNNTKPKNHQTTNSKMQIQTHSQLFQIYQGQGDDGATGDAMFFPSLWIPKAPREGWGSTGSSRTNSRSWRAGWCLEFIAQRTKHQILPRKWGPYSLQFLRFAGLICLGKRLQRH